MPLHLTPELEQRVTALARETQREPEAVLAEIVREALDRDEAFMAEVEAGIADADRGDVVPHDEALRRFRAAIERHGGRRTQ